MGRTAVKKQGWGIRCELGGWKVVSSVYCPLAVAAAASRMRQLDSLASPSKKEKNGTYL